ncbi:MAG: PTS lactose/cellobiose transporter subunit IIA [Erysipelotrichaceae bacterium]|nr:PTS lactose/cellobiose transporter subunit IIA [Erysipelotrichaceae bacterium]
MDETLIQAAMNVILHAGNARLKAEEAIDKAKAGDFSAADELMKEAHEEIVEAHATQTEIIQSEASGNKHELNILFIHAQDTLMTIMSELKMSGQIIDLYRALNERK